MFVRNVGIYPYHTTSQPRRPYSSQWNKLVGQHSALNHKFPCTLSGLAPSSRAVITRYRDGISNPKGQANTNVINYLINKPPSILIELLIPRRYCNNNYELKFVALGHVLGDHSILSSENNEHFYNSEVNISFYKVANGKKQF